MTIGFTKRPRRSAAGTAALLIAIFIIMMMPYLFRHIFIYTLSLSDIGFCLLLTALWGLLVYAIYSKLRKQELREEHIREKIDEELMRRMR
jgi:hypothetical protein